MGLIKLSSSAFRLTHRNVLFHRLTVQKPKAFFILSNKKTTAASEEVDERDRPLVFSTSHAATWSPLASRMGTEYEVPWFQPFCVMASLIVFMVYFCILREENDLDERLTWQLSDHFTGEAKAHLEASQQIPLQYGSHRTWNVNKNNTSQLK